MTLDTVLGDNFMFDKTPITETVKTHNYRGSNYGFLMRARISADTNDTPRTGDKAVAVQFSVGLTGNKAPLKIGYALGISTYFYTILCSASKQYLTFLYHTYDRYALD
jgi:hypothetical protein